MRAVCLDFECELIEFNGEPDHVHLLVNFSPKIAVSKLMTSLKGGVVATDTTGIPRTGPPLLASPTTMVGFLFRWPVAGALLSVLRQYKYIEQQQHPV